MQDCNSGFLEVGDIIGQYSREFGEVEIMEVCNMHFYASAVRYGRRWFLKGIVADAADCTLLRQQLLKEFEILSRLSHPGVVQCASIEDVADLGLCLVMEWIEGTTLSNLLASGTLTRSERMRILTEIAEAMEHVHSMGIVHRDLKPSNIMVRGNGSKVVIVDFGLADTDEYTLLKNPAGSEGYMSARQKSARTPFTGDDVYSLGIIMQSLYPEWKSIIRRCIGTEEKRFANAVELFQTIRIRGQRKKRMLIAGEVVMIFVSAIVITAMSIHSRRLSSSMAGLESRLDSVTLIAQSEQHHSLELEDSLRHLGKQLNSEIEFNNRIKKHSELMQSLKQQIKDGLDRAYHRFLTTDPNPHYEDSQAVMRLLKLMTAVKNNVLASTPGLTYADREALEIAYAIYQGEILKHWSNIHTNEN